MIVGSVMTVSGMLLPALVPHVAALGLAGLCVGVVAALTSGALAAVLALAAVPALARNVTDPDYPRSLDSTGPVAVSWSEPAGFTEIRYSRNRYEAARGDWVRSLARHLADRAARVMAPGERLEVEITDIQRAGQYEPVAGRLDQVRMVRDIYPPRIELRYTRYDASGAPVDSGERELTDIGFLAHSAHALHSQDPLRHEKRLLDQWIRHDLADGANPGGPRGD